MVADYPVGLRTRRPGFKSQRLRFHSSLSHPLTFPREEVGRVIERSNGRRLSVHRRSFTATDGLVGALLTAGMAG